MFSAESTKSTKKNFFHPIFLVIFFLLFFPSLSLSLSMAFQNKNKMETEKKNIENSDQKLFVFFVILNDLKL